MKSKTIIVTGSSRGIGKAISKKLLESGYTVFGIAKDENELKKVTSEFSIIGDFRYQILDLSVNSELKNFTKSWNQPVYGIVNNAGICKTEELLEDFEVWNDVIKTNLEGPYYLVKGLASYIESPGRIVNISSQLGKEGRAGYGAYSASKFGLIGLTKCWAKELGIKEITVNAICPGWVDTEMSKMDMLRIAKDKGVSVEELYKKICAPLELKRFTTPDEVAELVLFLLSEKASGITGRDWLLNTIWNQE